MKDFLARLGVQRYINAHDTYTVYGGSRMAENTKRAMDEISRCFVNVEQLQRALGSYIAKLTHNESAYITNGAAGGIQLCTAVCMAEGSQYKYSQLPQCKDIKNEIIVFHCQHNCYDKSIESTGAKIIKIGDSDETLEYQLEGAIGDKTAAIFYFPSALYTRGSMSIEKTIEIAHRHGVPVVVDAAAQLPPIENLWKYTDMGADMVIFSGGKTLSGPQASGLIVGKKEYIEDCIRFGAPMHGICRSSKVSREGMVGLTVAIENYVQMDHKENDRKLSGIVDRFIDAMNECYIFETCRIEHGPVGQRYPRAFGKLKNGIKAEEIAKEMLDKHIYIGVDRVNNGIYFSPLNVTLEETEIVIQELKNVINENDGKVKKEEIE